MRRAGEDHLRNWHVRFVQTSSEAQQNTVVNVGRTVTATGNVTANTSVNLCGIPIVTAQSDKITVSADGAC